MKKQVFIVGTVSSILGCLIGASLVMSVNSRIETVHEDYEVVEAHGNSTFLTVSSSDNTTLPRHGNCDLVAASEKSVGSVVHITTHFVKEEITYDPFMRLFYGEDAYRKRERRGMASGSGVIISPEGYIVTNNHVVADAEKIDVVLNDVKYSGKLIGTDPSTDLAVVKIAKNGLDYLEFGDSDELRLGEWVLAVGNPLNLQTTVTAGIVSAKNRSIDLLTTYDPEAGVFPVESFIQTDAAVNSGNSGGALVNQEGKLVGINTAIASGNGYNIGYSFAVPANIVKKVTYDLVKYGEVQRVQLGVNILDNNPTVKAQYALSTADGIVITNIIEGGNADNSELQAKDVILAIDGVTINSVALLKERLALHKPGDTIKMKVQRGSITKVIAIEMD
jgi:serine protease Do